MTFCPYSIVSTIDSVNYGFGTRVILSTLESIHLGGCLLGIFPLGSLVTRHSSHIGLFPSLVLSNLDSAHFCFYLLESLSTCMFIYLDSVH